MIAGSAVKRGLSSVVCLYISDFLESQLKDGDPPLLSETLTTAQFLRLSSFFVPSLFA